MSTRSVNSRLVDSDNLTDVPVSKESNRHYVHSEWRTCGSSRPSDQKNTLNVYFKGLINQWRDHLPRKNIILCVITFYFLEVDSSSGLMKVQQAWCDVMIPCKINAGNFSVGTNLGYRTDRRGYSAPPSPTSPRPLVPSPCLDDDEEGPCGPWSQCDSLGKGPWCPTDPLIWN